MSPHDAYFELAHLDGDYIARAYYQAGDPRAERQAEMAILSTCDSVKEAAKQLRQPVLVTVRKMRTFDVGG